MIESVDKYREWDAAYVLGALSTDDRREYERHLAGCVSCTTAVAEFAGMPGLLMKIDANTAQTLATVPANENVFALPLEPFRVWLELHSNEKQAFEKGWLPAGQWPPV